jgi:transposase
VAVKSEAKQALSAVFRARDLLVGQRTQLINALLRAVLNLADATQSLCHNGG